MNPSRAARAAALAALAMLALAPPARAGTNLGPEGYPAPACGELPRVPARPEKFESEDAIDAYNREVAAYNDAMERFVRCIQDYVDAAAEDVARIREASRQAIERARE